MAALAVLSPYAQFFDLDGKPLDDGEVYIGSVNSNPKNQSNQVTVFWDSDATQPASQPLRTLNGYIYRDGTPSNVYINGSYSIATYDKRTRLVAYSKDASSAMVSSGGSGLIGYDGGTVQDVLDGAKTKADYVELRAYTGRATGIRITAPGIAGFFQSDALDTTTADNGGTVIVDASGRRWKRLFDGAVSVKWFGAKGDGVTDDTAAFSAAVNYANSKNPGSVDAPNVVGVTIFIPNGRYKILSPVTPILKGSVAIRGESANGVKLLLSYNGWTFTWNNTGAAEYVVNGEFTDVTVEYLAAPGASAGIWYLENSYRIQFRNIVLINVGHVCQMGSAARPVGAIYFTNISGYCANAGHWSFLPVAGAGCFFSDVRMFVGGVLAPTIDRVNSMSTAAGTNFLQMDAASWDTVQFSNCFIERYYYAINLQASAGIIINNIYIENTYFDYIANRVLNAASLSTVSGGVFNVKFTGCWLASWDNTAVYIAGPGAIRGFEFVNCDVISAGTYGYFLNLGANGNQVQIIGGKVAGTNRLNLSASGIALVSGSKFTIFGVNSGFDSTLDGFPWQAIYGVSIDPNLDHYTVTGCELQGAIAPTNLGANAAGSQNRIIKNNRGTNFHNVSVAPSMTSGTPFTNTLPYAIRFNVFGGTVTGISFNGNGISGATSGQFLLNPGDSITVSYSSNPTFSYSGLN